MRYKIGQQLVNLKRGTLCEFAGYRTDGMCWVVVHGQNTKPHRYIANPANLRTAGKAKEVETRYWKPYSTEVQHMARMIGLTCSQVASVLEEDLK